MMALYDVVDTYCTAWNTTDVGDRGRLLRVAWTADCRYSDPLVYDLDRTALVAHIGMLLEKFPGSVIRRTSMIDSHPAGLRFGFVRLAADGDRSEEHTSELQSLMRISYAVFCLKKKNKSNTN